MKSKEKRNLPYAQKLSSSIGSFIHYWGFRKVHGAIWSQLYLSRTPLSCTDLTHRLGVSKALISPALDELCKFKLILVVPSPNEKTKLYEAQEDINAVIHHILRIRESKMLKQITMDFSKFQKKESHGGQWNPERVQSLGEMILSANVMLELMLVQTDLMKLPEKLGK